MTAAAAGERFDVAIVGAGVVGAMAARSIAGKGHSVALLERWDAGHTHGSSHGASRIFRLSYDTADWVDDCVESLELWRVVERESGRTLITTTGGFDIGPQARAHAEAMTERGVPFETLSATEASQRFGLVNFPKDALVIFQPDAGIAHADESVAAAIAVARERGARYLPETRVLSIEPGEDEVTVSFEGGELMASVVAVTAGSWSRELLAPLGIELPVKITRETVAYFPVPDGPIPSIVDWTEDPPFFSLLDPGGRGVKAGWHHAGTPIEDPEAPGDPDPRVVEGLTRWAQKRFRGAGEPSFAETCLYTTTADERHIFERHGRVVVGSACSGHGFKFAPLSGERVAAKVLEAL